MLKYLFILIFYIAALNSASCQTKDTAVFFLKKGMFVNIKVDKLDICDFIRIIVPPDSRDKLVTVKEFYKDGHLRTVAKSEITNSLYINGTVLFEGDLINFFPNGSRAHIAHYNHGRIDRKEYYYYPNGKLFSVEGPFSGKYLNASVYDNLFLECYDKNGTKITSDGNGNWLIYDSNFDNILLEGQVVNGCREGEWRGRTTIGPDSVSYVYRLKKNEVISSTGYDKNGQAYAFQSEDQTPDAEGGVFTFTEKIRKRFVLPQNINKRDTSIDTLLISFTVEKDGTPKNIELLGTQNLELLGAVRDAFINCPKWTPRKFYGIPLRSIIRFQLKYIRRKDNNGHFKLEEHSEYVPITK